jgi:hypothetical protein
MSVDIDGTKVNEGDKVLCIDDSSSFGRLRAGSVYVAECLKWSQNDKNSTYVMGGNPAAVHSMERFRKI